MEDFKQKIQKQKRLKNKTLKAVKNYLPTDELKFLEAQLDEEPILVKPTNVIELQPKKQTPREEQINKKIFSSDYEKYEWLIPNCLDSDTGISGICLYSTSTVSSIHKKQLDILLKIYYSGIRRHDLWLH